LQEARKQEHLIDGFFLREFKIFPDGCNPERLMDFQKEFIMYLCIATPSNEALSSAFCYEIDKRELERKDFVKEYLKNKSEKRLALIEGLAKSKGLTLEDYTKDGAEKLRERALKELHDQYVGVLFEESSEEEEVVQSALDRANRLAEKMKEGQEQSAAIRRLIGVPDNIPESLKNMFETKEEEEVNESV